MVLNDPQSAIPVFFVYCRLNCVEHFLDVTDCRQSVNGIIGFIEVFITKLNRVFSEIGQVSEMCRDLNALIFKEVEKLFQVMNPRILSSKKTQPCL
jgi:hypothetical protein